MGSTGSVYHIPHKEQHEHQQEQERNEYKESYNSEYKREQHIAKNVNDFLNKQVSELSIKVIEQRKSKSVPKINANDDNIQQHHNLRQAVSSTQLISKTSSVRAHALKQHSRQKNTYISASSLKFSINNGLVNRDRSSDTNDRSGSSLGINSGENPNNIINNNNNNVNNNGNNNNNNLNEPATKQDNPIKKKFNLKLQINDEEDWIQVEDDDANDIMTPRVRKDALGRGEYGGEQSYTLTQSGTIFVNGFCEGIGKNGITVGSRYQTKLPMSERLVFLCQLGHGASSTVYKALDISELRLVAVKVVPVFDRNKRRQMVRELNTLFQMLRKKEKEFSTGSEPTYHVNINFDLKSRKNGIQALLNHDSSKSNDDSNNNDSDNINENKTYRLYSQHYIVDFYDAFSNLEEGGVALMMEYMDGGSLQDIADSGGCSDEGVLANIAVQALAGLDFLHKCNQIHRDIKPANLLINLDGDVKVSDLGILRQIEPEIDLGIDKKLQDQDVSKLHRAHTFVGTTTYMAPERIDGQEYSYSSDIWSFGLAMMTLSLGRLPFDTNGGFWQILRCVRDSAPPRLPNDGNWSDEFQDFLSQCLQHDPDKRATASKLLTHPFLSKAFPEESENMEQIGAEELKSIVKALYSHIDTLRNESIKTLIQSKSSARRSAREALERMESTSSTLTSDKGISTPTTLPNDPIALGLPSTYEMAHFLLFNEKPATSARDKSPKYAEEKGTIPSSSSSSSSSKIESQSRFKLLAKQLHLPLPIALHIARSTLISLVEDSINNISTPKSKHSSLLHNKKK